MISIENYLHSRVVFWKLIADGVDLAVAMEWRAQFLLMHDLMVCKKCKRSRPCFEFFVIFPGTLMQSHTQPCKECQRKWPKSASQLKRLSIMNMKTCHP